MERSKYPNRWEQDWQDWQRDGGCIVCGDPAMIHHCVGTGKQAYQDGIYVGQKFTLPLCWCHHQGPFGIHNSPLVMAEQAGINGTTRKEIEKELFAVSLERYEIEKGNLPFDDDTVRAILSWSR